ncbi:hypothetical protein C8R44DRAFT_738993 [Mycena epipterygia]|nr:hypothetical protein C8R44DRAFT_738993 [Mycena epipterygia]
MITHTLDRPPMGRCGDAARASIHLAFHDVGMHLLARIASGGQGFSIRELMALIGAHSTCKQRFQAVPTETMFDSTPDVWDLPCTRLMHLATYSETQSTAVVPYTYKLARDVNFSTNAMTQKDYNRFIGNQDNWGNEYSAAHEKMSLLGVDKSTLTDCSEILPLPIHRLEEPRHLVRIGESAHRSHHRPGQTRGRDPAIQVHLALSGARVRWFWVFCFT